MTTTPSISAAVATTLKAAAALSPAPGYINGDEYGEWYIEAGPDLLRALAQLALAHGSEELAARLERLSHPLCREPLDCVLMPDTMPRLWCGNPVEVEGSPCADHAPARAAELGRCTWVGTEGELRSSPQRICRGTPVPGEDRCSAHTAYCRVVKRDLKVCNRINCTIPQHQKLAG
ncbi:hypothetical protein [Streptomyces sp. NPDC059783]|uniref:hypothetical protein n=1 Tax=Streptomyces sp. NPDC059783 TaxID=3346944 RepID=UPI00365CFFC7